MSDERDGDFLARWSRRKLAARRAAVPAEEPEAAAREELPVEVPPVEAAPEPPPNLPDIATLEAGSDFKPFLQAGVPKDLRRDALRKLWRVNPIINSLDGLDDYYCTTDLTDRATVVADLRTAYKVGRGMVDALERLAEKAEPAPAPGEEAAQVEHAEEEEPHLLAPDLKPL